MEIEKLFNQAIEHAEQIGQKAMNKIEKYVLSRIEKFNKNVYNKSTAFTKRSISASIIVLIYLFIIAGGGFIFNATMLLLACLSLREIDEAFSSVKEGAKKNKIKKLSLLYVVATFGSLIGIRNYRQGAQITLWMFFVVSSVDSAAYVYGKKFGKRPIFPNVSPGKTMEGLIAGFVGGIASSFLFYIIFNNFANGSLGFIIFTFLTIALIVLANFGDFVESKIKRSAGIKDIGNIIPGHGGILDRFDSFTIAGPVLWLIIGMLGGVLF